MTLSRGRVRVGDSTVRKVSVGIQKEEFVGMGILWNKERVLGLSLIICNISIVLDTG